MKHMKRILAVLMALLMLINGVVLAHADYEDGKECPECGKYHWDDWLACDDCGMCIDCAADYTCPYCGGCLYCADNWCDGCRACPDCAEIICSECDSHCFKCADDSKFCITCDRCGEYKKDGSYGEGWYTGMVKLKERYCKGYFEIRCIVNSGSGFWSAFWLQADAPYTASVSKGGVGGAEVDIFESMSWGDKIGSDSVSQNIHCAGVDGVQEGFQSQNLGTFYGKNIYEEYNTYGLEWTDNEYIFYINGVETRRSSFGNGVSEVLEDVIVSLEIPAEEELAKLDKDTYKTEYLVDYVRIYQK